MVAKRVTIEDLAAAVEALGGRSEHVVYEAEGRDEWWFSAPKHTRWTGVGDPSFFLPFHEIEADDLQAELDEAMSIVEKGVEPWSWARRPGDPD